MIDTDKDEYEFECYNCGSRFNHERILCPDCGVCDKCGDHNYCEEGEEE